MTAMLPMTILVALIFPVFTLFTIVTFSVDVCV